VPTTDRVRSPGRVDRVLDRFRTTPAGRIAVKVVIGTVGFIVIATGIVLLPLPGPGWLIIFAGLAIWSLEFHWARKLHNFARGKVSSWTGWVKTQSPAVRVGVGLGALLFLAAVIGVSLRLSFGPGVFARIANWF
jgi:uncharacterized protein (TIGR02611 family)